MNKKWEWYVIRVISWTEENIKKSILQRTNVFDLQNEILEVLIPAQQVITFEKKTWWKKRKVKKMFPWYILINMNITNESWYIVRNTPWVTWFLWPWNTPSPVSWDELNKLKWIMNKKEECLVPMKIWEFVIVKEWPFKWNEWVVLDINKIIWVLSININLLWRDVAVEIWFNQVKLKLKQ